MTRRDWTALTALIPVLIKRLLREGMVMRSMIWPSGLAAVTLLLTLSVAAVLRVSSVVAVSSDLDHVVVDAIVAEGWEVERVPDAEAAAATVHRGGAWAGTDGATLWIRYHSNDAVRLEAVLQRARGSRWQRVPEQELPSAPDTAAFGSRIVQMVMLLFSLYGVVFGLGMVARDRDDGTLEAELSLPTSRWVSGASRWIAGTFVLTVFLVYAIAMFDALVGVQDSPALMLHGFAAAGGSLTIGIVLIGSAGVKQGFSSPLAFGLTTTTGLLGLGAASPTIGQYLPLASVTAGGSGIVPALLTALGGVLASAVFAWRSAKA